MVDCFLFRKVSNIKMAQRIGPPSAYAPNKQLLTKIKLITNE